MKLKNNKLIEKGVAKVPVIMQMESSECGAASLAMIMAYFGKWVPLEEVRTECDVSIDGAKPSNIVRAARKFGLDAHIYRFEFKAIQEKGIFPCIIFVNYTHFVVLNGFRHGKAYINDPAGGSYSMSIESFDKCYTGLTMVFEPGENFTAEGKKASIYEFLKINMNGSFSAAVLIGIASVMTGLMASILMLLNRVFIDYVLGHEDHKWVNIFILLLFSISVIQIAAALIRDVNSFRLIGKLDIANESGIMWKILKKPIRFFSQRYIGDLQQRQNSSINVASTIVNTFAPLLINALLTVIYAVMLLNYSPFLGLIGLLSTILGALVAKTASRKKVNIIRAQNRDLGRLTGITTSGIDMIDTIKASGAENGFLRRWASYQALVNKSTVKYNTINISYGFIPEIISLLSHLIIIATGVYLINAEALTLGALMSVTGIIGLIAQPAGQLISSMQKIQEMRSDMERIKDIADYPEDSTFKEETEDSDSEPGKLSGRIEFKNVSFGYSRLGQSFLNDFNLTIEKGQTIALVGSSGCGKSTIIKLLTGLLRQSDGEILYDGRPLSDLTQSEFINSVAIVEQDIFLFDDTVENNIKMWDSSIDNYTMVRAAQDAQIHDDIIRRPGGYQNMLVGCGKELSGGQCQRIEIARALVGNPSVIILDEATSALDPTTELNVMNAIRGRNITTVIAAHRLSTIKDCDVIYVLEEGKIVEAGKHEELLQKNGRYAELIKNEQ